MTPSPDTPSWQQLGEAAERAPSGPWSHYLGKVSGPSAITPGQRSIADVRGWGYYTGKGHGALGLSDTQAVKIMNDLGNFIALANPSTILAKKAEHDALVARVEELEAAAQFALDRIDAWAEESLTDASVRGWIGHVAPALGRLRTLIQKEQA